MSDTPLLSLCIPTWARRSLLKDLLDTVDRQNLDDVEIVLSDNHSVDGTRELFASYAKRWPRTVYQEHPENAGFDWNIYRAAALATGEYCWLMGDDDLLLPGAFARLKAILRRDRPSGILMGSAPADGDGRLLDPGVLDHPFPEEPRFLRPDELLRYGAWFGQTSSQLFRRDLWARAHADGQWRDFIQSQYMQSFMCLKTALHTPPGTWMIDPSPSYVYRSSLTEQLGSVNGWQTRLVYEYSAALRIYDALLTPEQAKRIMYHETVDNTLRNLRDWRRTKPTRAQVREVRALLRKTPLTPSRRVMTALALHLPAPLFFTLYEVARGARRWVRTLRRSRWSDRRVALRPPGALSHK